MPPDEVHTSVALARALIASQFPRWAGLPVRAVSTSGNINALYRLGNDMVVRMPRVSWAGRAVEAEHDAYRRLAGRLPLAIPEPLALGAPDDRYPLPWSVYRWIDGDNAAEAPITDLIGAAADLAGFLRALWSIETDRDGGWEELADNHASTRKAIELVGAPGALAVWESALSAPRWTGPPVWIHGDMHGGNVLVSEGRISAVIDFGGDDPPALGDPATDLLIAWSFFTAESRDAFRAELGVDEATWSRGRGFALSWAVNYLAYHAEGGNPAVARMMRRTLAELLADARSV